MEFCGGCRGLGANTLYDRRREEWQRTLDEDHAEVYRHATGRLQAIYQDPLHYIHEKPPKHQGQRKKRLISSCKQAPEEGRHRWAPHRSGCQVSKGQTMAEATSRKPLDT